MKMIALAGTAMLSLIVAGCGKAPNAAPENRQAAGAPTTSQSAQVYSGTGTVKSITGDQVAIAHGPISGIGWPAMTMTFTAPPDIAKGVKIGNQVDFSFRQNGSAYVLTSVNPQ